MGGWSLEGIVSLSKYAGSKRIGRLHSREEDEEERDKEAQDDPVEILCFSWKVLSGILSCKTK